MTHPHYQNFRAAIPCAGGIFFASKEARTEIKPIGHQKDGYEEYSRAKQSNLNYQRVLFFEPFIGAQIVFWDGDHCDLQKLQFANGSTAGQKGSTSPTFREG